MTNQSSPQTIRPVNPTADHASLDTIFTTTAGPAFKPEPARTIGSWAFCHQYPYLTPSTCFVLSTATGEAVGYILGAPNTASFVSQSSAAFDSMLVQMNKTQASLQRPPDYAAQNLAEPKFEDDAGAWLLHVMCNKPKEIYNGNVPGLWDEYPAHFHIDILPEYQRQGWGRKLIERVFEAFRAEGVKGVYLGMEAANESAERFYRAVGFERYGRVLDGGATGEVGRTGGANDVVFMVKGL